MVGSVWKSAYRLNEHVKPAEVLHRVYRWFSGALEPPGADPTASGPRGHGGLPGVDRGE